MLQGCNGLGPPASPGDVAVVNVNNNTGSRDVDFYTPDGQFKFSTLPLNCTTGVPLKNLRNEPGYLSLQPVDGCAATLKHVRTPARYQVDRQD